MIGTGFVVENVNLFYLSYCIGWQIVFSIYTICHVLSKFVVYIIILSLNLVVLIYKPYAACAIKIYGGEMRELDIILCDFFQQLLKEQNNTHKYKIIYTRYRTS